MQSKSWLNMVEIEIGVLRTQCLDRRIAERAELEAEIAIWERRRNANQEKIQWMFNCEKAREKGVLRARDLARQGIHPQTVSRLVQQGELTRAGRGRYLLSKSEPSENIGLALAAAAAPQAVVCLLSALRFHNLGTQAPHEVWIAIERLNTRPRVDYPPIRIMRFSGKAFTFGIERHEIDGIRVKIYSAPKTVADCFRFRNKIGLDVALEALREGLMDKRFTRDELWTAAKACRVTTVIRPYLEVL